MNRGSELKILWDKFRSQIAELWFPYDRTIAMDRRRSQTIAKDRTWLYLLRSFAIVCDHDRRIADDRRSVFLYDRRRSHNILRSAIRDPRSSAIIWKPGLSCAYIELWMHLGSLESTQEARVALGCRLEQLLRFFRALQTSRVHP